MVKVRLDVESHGYKSLPTVESLRSEIDNNNLSSVVVDPKIFTVNFLTDLSGTRIVKEFSVEAFLHTCSVLESFVLNDIVMMPPPFNTTDFAVNYVSHKVITDFLNVSMDDLAFLKLPQMKKPKVIPSGYSDLEAFANECVAWINVGLKDEELEKEERLAAKEDLKGLVEHFLLEAIASDLSASYIADFGVTGMVHKRALAYRVNSVNRITPMGLYERISQALREEMDELAQVGWACDLRIPPLALNILSRCGGDRNEIGDLLLEERRKAENLRRWSAELMAELETAKSINDARKVKHKIEKLYQDLSGSGDCEILSSITWSGLLAAFPKSVWDGISREDFDLRSLTRFLVDKPAGLISRWVRQRHYIYLMDLKAKARKIDEYAPMIEKTFGFELTKKDAEKIDSLSKILSIAP